jgi:hypothetical protein
MKTHPSSETAFSRVRVLFALIFCALGGGLAMFSFAADPAAGTISPGTATAVTWNGTATGLPPAAGGEADCEEGANCDTFKLTLTGNQADWVGKQVKVRLQWLANSTDYDFYIHKGSVDGPVVASSGNAASTSEETVLNPASSSVGTGDFFVRAVYFAATPADQYAGSATVVGAGLPPVPAPIPVTGLPPRYQNYTPPAAGPNTMGLDAGEPSIGVNWNSETGQNGGRSMYMALLQTLRITFDDSCPASPSALWENKSFVTTSAQTFDPILFTDHTSGRTMVSQLEFPAGSVASASGYTDNDGDVWVASTGAGPGSGIDHQTIGGGGPFHAPLINPAYPGAVYYCSQLPNATCAISLDGGQTYGPAVPVDSGMVCGGLHGHIKVGPDGTAYLPNKGCGTQQAAIVSEDNGVTWQVRAVPSSSEGGSDAAVGIGRGDKVKEAVGGAPIGRVYLGFADGDNRAVIATSNDRGVTWSQPLDVGAAFGINNVVFPAVVAGDDDRAAFAFYGTPTAGGLQGPKFNGVWHLYVAHTYDGGQTWRTIDVTPNDPLQRGCIWLGGGSNICRNMLDFMGIDVDKRGRVVVGYNDGCAGAECSQAPATATGNSYTALAAIARQTAGKGLFAAQDAIFPDTPTAPGAPFLTALRNGGSVKLAWSVSNDGGAPIVSYNILRGTTSGGEALLATVPNTPGTTPRYEDTTAADTAVTYYYKVTAANTAGISCDNNEVPAPYVGDSRTGYRVSADPTGDQKTAPADPDLDVQSVSIAEPASGPNLGRLEFQIKVASLATVPNNRMWRTVWNSPNSPVGQFYVGMTKDAAGAVTFEYGTVETAVVGLVLGVPTTTKLGDADSGSFTPDGLITIGISPDKVGNPQKGDLLGDFSTRTYNAVKTQIRSTDAIDATSNATANDFTANAATYALVGPGSAGLQNISTRAQIGTGEKVLIGGFIVTGSAPKKVVVRGLGPSLAAFQGITDPVHDPVLELYNSTPNNPAIATNDNWQDSQGTEISNTGLAPGSPLDSAIVQTLAPGAYTVIVRDKDTSAARLGIVEVFDVAPSVSAQIGNLSSRGFVGAGDNVLIGGLIIGPSGTANGTVLVRSLGPSLGSFGVAGTLPDPTLRLVDQNGAQLAANDNWRANEAAIQAQAPSLAPTRDEEAALVASLPPGLYTAVVEGKNATGVATVEVYDLP